MPLWMPRWFILQKLFEDHEFFGLFQTVLQAFLQLWEVAVHGFCGMAKEKYSRKTARWSLGLLMLQGGVFRTQSNNYDGAF